MSSKQEITWRERQSETPTPLPDRRLPLGRLFTVPYFIVRSSGSSGDYSRADSVLGLRLSLDSHFPIMGHFSSEIQLTQASFLAGLPPSLLPCNSTQNSIWFDTLTLTGRPVAIHLRLHAMPSCHLKMI